MATSPPFSDIGINPFQSDRRQFEGCVATVTGITYGMVVIGDSGSTNARDAKLPAGAGATGVRGVVSDQGDPNNSGQFDSGAEFGCCVEGIVEALLDAGQIATKDQPAITGATAGTVKPVASESAPYDVVGYFGQTLDNSGGSSPLLVSLKVSVQRRFA